MPVATPQTPFEAHEPPIYIADAGLVLLSPYLPHLFERLGLLSAAGGESRIEGPEAMSRAVHLLQYLATGRLDTPATQLALSKLLAGIPLSTPIAPEIDASPADLDICNGLLTAAISNWPSIRGTSIDGLRETFLQREGRLQRADDHWRLDVQRKALDVLVDQVPWSFATVSHRWMPVPLHVSW
ncbi:contractile injection system tape measure protein [Sphingomonas koreensis]